VLLANTVRFSNRFISLFSISFLLLSLFQVAPAQANGLKRPEWLAACPNIFDVSPTLPTPKTTKLVFQNTGQEFTLLKPNSTDYATEPISVIGCYVALDSISSSDQAPPWQIGSLNRDAAGYYFRNAAGVTWRLKLSTDEKVFEIQPGSSYYKGGGLGFKIDTPARLPADCKMDDYRLGELRLGFPRNNDRVPATGTSKNLIIVLDFPDAPFTGDLMTSVNNVLSPKITNEFFLFNSYNKLNVLFDVHPKVVRVNSSEKSFAPNSEGKFDVQGGRKDLNLINEALRIANTQADLSGYASLNFFAPTADSMRYYGSAFPGHKLTAGKDTIVNSQLVNGVIGTINTPGVPSWKVFAHEYGHLLGMYDLYLQSGPNTGKSPGPFDLMGNTSGSANTFLGFHRFVQGWLPDTDVVCQLSPIGSEKITLAPINSGSGKRLYIHPISGSKALMIEYRTNTNFDTLGANTGLLAYVIDFTIASIKGPVQIIASEQDKPVSFNTDLERYATAPLSTNQHAKTDGLVVFAHSVIGDTATFSVMTEAEFRILEAERNKPVVVPTPVTKTITCTNGVKTKRVKAVKPKCPAGYKRR